MSKKNKSKPDQQRQPRKTCIFCGATPLTEEHIFGNWIRHLIPRANAGYVGHRTEVVFTDDSIQEVGSKKIIQGNLGNKTLKVVCGPCNNEWLSNNFDTPAISCLSDMILGNTMSLNQSQQKIAALWAVKTAMVAEFDDPKTRGVPANDLFFLRQNLSIPDGWKVWIGKYEGKTTLRFRHRGKSLFAATTPPELRNLKGLPFNSQTTHLVIGKLAVFVLSAPVDFNDLLNFGYDQYFEQIWPIRSSLINWPSRISVTDDVVEQATDHPFINAFSPF